MCVCVTVVVSNGGVGAQSDRQLSANSFRFTLQLGSTANFLSGLSSNARVQWECLSYRKECSERMKGAYSVPVQGRFKAKINCNEQSDGHEAKVACIYTKCVCRAERRRCVLWLKFSLRLKCRSLQAFAGSVSSLGDPRLAGDSVPLMSIPV